MANIKERPTPFMIKMKTKVKNLDRERRLLGYWHLAKQATTDKWVMYGSIYTFGNTLITNTVLIVCWDFGIWNLLEDNIWMQF